MNTLLSAIEKENNWTTTENGAVALSSTLSPILDLFGLVGAMRSRSEADIQELFIKAFAVDPDLTLKLLFYSRDIRGGLGERRIFRVILKYLANSKYAASFAPLIPYIPEYGRWDDLYAFVGTPLENEAFRTMKLRFDLDYSYLDFPDKASSISLLAKWLKSESSSSEESRSLARKTAKAFGLSLKEYRHRLSALRKHLEVTEVLLSSKQFTEINYSNVPSIASKNYRNAFLAHDAERYQEFLQKVKTGEAKINSSTLYPYDLLVAYANTISSSGSFYSGTIHKLKFDETIEAQWKSLSDFLTKEDNFLVMPDTSGSMESGLSGNTAPIHISLGLAIYCAEHSKGPFKNNFISFTNAPRLVHLDPSLSLVDRIKIAYNDKYVGYSTNLAAAFDLVLNSAVSQHLAPSDLPKAIVVISDMEIDEADAKYEKRKNFTQIYRDKFAAAGYELPTIVYWNVCARHNIFHAEADDNVRFISGASASSFKSLCENFGSTATELMLETLNSPRYKDIHF